MKEWVPKLEELYWQGEEQKVAINCRFLTKENSNSSLSFRLSDEVKAELTTRNTFRSFERLKSKILIDSLFKEGRSFFVHPFNVKWIVSPDSDKPPLQVSFSVPKKLYPRAVDRNSIKRKMRERFRLNKPQLYHQLIEKNLSLVFMIIYSRKVNSNDQVHTEMEKVILRLCQEMERFEISHE